MMRTLLEERRRQAARFDEELRRAYSRLKAKKHSAPAKVMVARSWQSGCTGCCGKINRTQNCTPRRPVARMLGQPESFRGRNWRPTLEWAPLLPETVREFGESESWSQYEAEEMDDGATEPIE